MVSLVCFSDRFIPREIIPGNYSVAIREDYGAMMGAGQVTTPAALAGNGIRTAHCDNAADVTYVVENTSPNIV